MIADGDIRFVKDGKVKIPHKIVSDMYVESKIAVKGTVKHEVLAYAA